MKVISTYSVKGGVGKTTTAVNLAWEAHMRGLRVLIWDLDPQGSATYLMQAKPKLKGSAEALVQGKTDPRKAVRSTPFDGIDVLPADESNRDLELALDASKKSTKRLGKVLGPLAKNYDVAILDVPPGASLLAQNVLRASDLIAVPLVPGALSIRSLDQVEDLVGSSGPTLLAFLSMLDRRKRAHKDAEALLATHQHVVGGIAIPYNADVERVGELREPIGCFAASSSAATAYKSLWNEIAQRIKLVK